MIAEARCLIQVRGEPQLRIVRGRIAKQLWSREANEFFGMFMLSDHGRTGKVRRSLMSGAAAKCRATLAGLD